MGAGRRRARDEWRDRASRRRSGLDVGAVEAALQRLLEAWPWLAEQYRRGAIEPPVEPLAAAIRRYLEHAGL